MIYTYIIGRKEKSIIPIGGPEVFSQHKQKRPGNDIYVYL